MIAKYFQFVKTKWFIAVSCFVLGAVIILGVRFFTYKPDIIHYHANFALYINGNREEFKGAQYYKEAQMCVSKNVVLPAMRAHMHDNVNNVVHVEDHAVTWGNFFSTLGWTMGPTTIIDPNGTIYAESGNIKLNLWLNGQNYTDFGGLNNTVIKDKDKLLVSYGNEDQSTLKKQYSAIPSTAEKYDNSKDPASCSGGQNNVTIHDRIVHML